MKNIRIILCMLALLAAGSVWGQAGTDDTPIDQLNGQTLDLSSSSINITDPGGIQGNYSGQGDYSVILTANCTGENDVLRLRIVTLDVDPLDTLFLYDGNTTSAPVLIACNNNNSPVGQYFYPSAFNASGAILLRFKSSGQSQGHGGFFVEARCAIPCVSLTPILDSVYFKARNGVIYDTMTMGVRYQTDTLWDYEIRVDEEGNTYNDTTGYDLMDTPFWGLELCEGDSLVLQGRCDVGPGLYTLTDNLIVYSWNWGDGDTSGFFGYKNGAHKYRDVGCYDISLKVSDYLTCQSATIAQVRVRIAIMPIKTIFDLPNICNTDSFLVNVGFDGDGATLTLRPIEFAKAAAKTNQIRTFIPDGPTTACRELGLGNCFQAPVTFDEFPIGRTVQAKEDICSICLNYEHSFMGDYSLNVVCPNGNKAVLKFASSDPEKPDEPRGSYDYGSGDWTGFPLDYANTDIGCDSLFNPFGDGLEYCFSRNGAYTLFTGEPCDIDSLDCIYHAVPGAIATYGPNYPHTGGTNTTFNRHITSHNLLPYDHVYGPLPSYFQNGWGGTTPRDFHSSTIINSNHEAKTGYYLPDEDFASLIGCPLNGQWSMEVCDYWGADNGWVFSWGMDICGISSGNCEYQVGIDSVTWTPDSAYGDFLLGHWRGAVMTPRDSVQTWVATPDTAGRFKIDIRIYDEFGCRWDTATYVRSVWNPMPDLGADTVVLCSDQTILLDASDRTTPFTNQTYAWEPYGDTTSVIETRSGLNTSTLYLVEVTNTEYSIRCKARDSVRVSIYRSPEPNFDPGIYPLEGCEPFTVHFQNNTQYGDAYRWEFGDGAVSTAENPTHTYATGQYGFKFYATSVNGCKDSLIYDQLITVFPAPVAKFSWEPINPTVLHPDVHFINLSEPQSDAVKFYWELQYDRDNPLSYHTMLETNPSFTWATGGEDISGTYIARLIAKTNERGPSGRILECRDTVENTILLVNDFLQFPNVITANGDGINDIFEIKNLIHGLGYPNNSLSIYNRWGKRVYHKTNISSEEDFWDPAKENMPAGTYFWRFSGKGYLGDIERNGAVEVLR